MNINELRDTVLQAGSVQSRLAKVYAEALIAAALGQPNPKEAVIALGEELGDFVTGVLNTNPDVASFLASPAVGKRAKASALGAALPGNASDLFRGLLSVLTKNNRLNLLAGIAGAYRQLLDDRAGRVRVKVTSAVELSEAQRSTLTSTLAALLKQQPVLATRVDPNLLGGMVVQIGDRVIDTSVRTRLNTLRTQLLDKGSSYVVQN
ncbi:MAG: ATP synthase F1 subunit delta [Planctomycetaceae bacterium]|nr:ATP synthase F1 subunit delta [Planctomycetaceae bacterium]